jgi:glutaredoxin-like protein NrdH
MDHDAAIRIITEGRGTHFDPAIVDALVRSDIVFRHAGLLLQGGPAVDELGVEMSPAADEDPAALEHVKSLGYLQAPVVVTDEDHWSGFRPDKIDELASRLV